MPPSNYGAAEQQLRQKPNTSLIFYLAKNIKRNRVFQNKVNSLKCLEIQAFL